MVVLHKGILKLVVNFQRMDLWTVFHIFLNQSLRVQNKGNGYLKKIEPYANDVSKLYGAICSIITTKLFQGCLRGGKQRSRFFIPDIPDQLKDRQDDDQSKPY